MDFRRTIIIGNPYRVFCVRMHITYTCRNVHTRDTCIVPAFR